MDDNGSAPEAGPSNMPKGIGSLVKKQSDVTRQGTQKLKFVPTLPARRKKEEAQQDAPAETVQAPSPTRGDGRGRGRGRGRGAETPRGAAPRPSQAEMTASGPFAMGPALAGTSARRTAPRSNFTPIMPPGPTSTSSLGGDLSNAPAPQLRKDKQRESLLGDATKSEAKRESDEEVYSEPDEGVEIVDMEDVGKLDWMAPDTLRKERKVRDKKRAIKVEAEEPSISLSSKRKERDIANDQGEFDPSESEDGAELEDLIEDFAFQANIEQEEGVREEHLYLFQFPEPFFTFETSAPPLSATPMDVDTPEPGTSQTKQRRVSFAPDVKPPAPVSATSAAASGDAPAEKDPQKVDGIIGQLEVYRSGAVKMRLGNEILLNVWHTFTFFKRIPYGDILQISEGTQPSFLQQAIHLDMENKRLHVIGEVNKRFVVSPDLDTLLAAMQAEDNNNVMALDDPDLIKMDA
ncbi:hypothetical protein ID866_6437 [Astraeus odoratus]|nr:hypothetical protein ID866_6437 [Astraeus odoratus]